ncbi:MAG: ACP phosphodiesterase [Bacteroidota bacterium]
MNYLGHLYFSNNDTTLMLNNLFGDFVKGKDLSHFPEEIRKGIYLHRSIDDYIDRFPKVGELQQALRVDLPKVSSIAVDLFFDHLLAKNWRRYHPDELDVFLERFYRSIDLDNSSYTSEFKFMISKMTEINWMSHYDKLEGLDKMCRGVSARISFENSLKDGQRVFLEHEEAVSQCFELYMESAIRKFNVDISK